MAKFRTTTKTVLSEIILGGQDGLVNVLGLVLGLTASQAEVRLIVAGGLAATFAEGISMGAVVFTSRAAEHDQYVSVRDQKMQMIRESPAQARGELEAIYQRKGFSGPSLAGVVKHISADEKLWLQTLMTEGTELRSVTQSELLRQSFTTGLSTIIGSIIPLIPFFLASGMIALGFSVVVSALILFGVGAYSASTTVGRPARGGLQMAVIGLGAALVGYLVGLIFRA